VDLTRDQKATDPDEIVRISKAGGFVSNGRVLGLLAVARAFGDSSLKTEAAPKAVTAGKLICFSSTINSHNSLNPTHLPS
jgi:serine/threonine protein phosphatase PrpC